MTDETMEKTVKIKNKLPAPVQITAEQLLREAAERLGGEQGKKRFYLDAGNLDDYRQRERTKFEDAIKRNRHNIALYLRYATWEQQQEDMQRARSVYERAVAVDPRQHASWLRYGEAEMRTGNVQHARNVWDRACTILPRHDQFWYKRVAMEEVVREYGKAREVFERWMRWEPDQNGWRSFIKFEIRLKEWNRARIIYEHMLLQYHAEPTVWSEFARFEEREAADAPDGVQLSDLRIMRTRSVFERSCKCVALNNPSVQSHLIEFAKFEARTGEVERARAIYKFALAAYPDSDTLRHSYVTYERQHGDPAIIGEIVLEKRRRQYERRVTDQPFDYDGWFDLLRLEEDFYRLDPGHLERVRDAYERAIAMVPPVAEKRAWRRYIYLWLFYALFEESAAGSAGRAIEVLKLCLKLIPHEKFTFAKAWIALADVHIRRVDVRTARLALGRAIGKCPKPKLFKHYIDMELELREFDRCRVLYEKYLEFDPSASVVWIKFAELERALQEEERTRALYELAIESALDVPELVWKAYIDWEVEESRFDRARDLYERLLAQTQHLKVFISYANMELLCDDVEAMRKVMKRGYSALQEDDRLVLVDAWRETELSLGNDSFVEEEIGEKYYPKLGTTDGGATTVTWPEQKDDNVERLLGLAKKWKQSA